MGCAFTKPADSASPVMVNSASINRREPAATVAPNRPPGPSLGPARPTSAGRVIRISPSFLGYPWKWPRASDASLSTQMNTHRDQSRPPKRQRTTSRHSRYWARTGSSSSWPLSEQHCHSAQIAATASGRSATTVSGGGSSASTAPGAARYSTVNISPE